MNAPSHPWEIEPADLRTLLAGETPPFVVDCRESDERNLASIQDTVHVPMGEISAHLPDLEQHAEETVVVHCHHGVRSLQVVAFLKEAGFEDIRSLAGGIDRWSIEIDSSIPRY